MAQQRQGPVYMGGAAAGGLNAGGAQRLRKGKVYARDGAIWLVSLLWGWTVKRFKQLRSVNKSYNDQALIYYTCITYDRQNAMTRRKIERLCRKAAGEYASALLEYLTTDAEWVGVCQKYHVGDRTLERVRRRFYELW